MEYNTNAKSRSLWNNEYFKAGYDVIMAILAAVIIASLFYQGQSDLAEHELRIIKQVDFIIWLIFVADYFIRLMLAENKAVFFRANIVDLISIIPLDIAFQGLRLARAANATRALRLFYMFRVFVYLTRLYKRLHAILATSQFSHILWFTFSTVIFGAIAISHIENMNIGDALWWSFVTTTTVGYGDIAPKSLWGRLIAVFLMIVGIGFLGMLTGTIATHFISRHNSAVSYKDETIKLIIAKLNDFQSLSIDDIDNMHSTLIALKTNQKEKEVG